MTALTLGEHLHLPLTAITSTFGILAVRGAGKSNTAAVMAEEMFANRLPFVVVDPVGAWWGLRSTAKGKSAGLPIPIFGGKHGDVPLERGAGVLVADLIVEKRLSCVLDLSEFHSEGDKKSFLLDFARRIYQKNENPLHLVLEEADDYIPQKPMRDEAQLLRAWENIVRRGRGRGLGMTIITQRSAAVNKNVLTQVETLIAMRTTGPQDIAAIEAWVKYNQQSTDLLKSLPSLKDGEAWIWSPHFLNMMDRHQIRRRRTFDSGATPKNVKTDQGKPMATLADIDLTALQHQMAATIEKAKADDPKMLRAELVKLKAELAKAQQAKLAAKEIIKEVPLVTDIQIKRIETITKQFAALQENAFRICKIAEGFVSELAKAMIHGVADQAARNRHVHESKDIPPPRHDMVRRVMPKPNEAIGRTEESGLSKAERMILTAMAQRHPENCSRIQASILSGYSITSSSFVNALGALRSKAFVRGSGDQNQITPEGLAALGAFDAPPQGAELLRWWMHKLGKAERTMLEQIYLHGTLSKERISELTGYSITSSSFVNALGKLRSLELISGRHELTIAEVFGE